MIWSLIFTYRPKELSSKVVVGYHRSVRLKIEALSSKHFVIIEIFYYFSIRNSIQGDFSDKYGAYSLGVGYLGNFAEDMSAGAEDAIRDLIKSVSARLSAYFAKQNEVIVMYISYSGVSDGKDNV